jgi:23S rRNA pseudouridine2605 synthase
MPPKSYNPKSRSPKPKSSSPRSSGSKSSGSKSSGAQFSSKSSPQKPGVKQSPPKGTAPKSYTAKSNSPSARPSSTRPTNKAGLKKPDQQQLAQQKPGQQKPGQPKSSPEKRTVPSTDRPASPNRAYRRAEAAGKLGLPPKPVVKKAAAKNTKPETARLNKVIADSGLCSRREADRMIEAGLVKVNGRLTNLLGTQVHLEKDLILVKGKPLPQQRKSYIALNKPSGIITTRSDENGRKTIYDILPPELQAVDPAGRLDKDTSGLLILSNDGDFIHAISHLSLQAKQPLEKRYRVLIDKPLNPKDHRTLLNGILLMPENKMAKMNRVQSVPNPDRATKGYTLEIGLLTGMNRQIRRSFSALGYQILKLKRVAFGPITLGNLKPGEHRVLKPLEIRMLLGKSN